MSTARIVLQAATSGSFCTDITEYKDFSFILCLNYQALNKEIKIDKFSLEKIEEVPHEMADLKIFSRLDIFPTTARSH